MQITCFTQIVVLQVTFLAVLHGAMWTYNGPEGEHHWSKHYPFCGGVFQSPIDIRTDLLRFDPALRPIVFHNYNLSSKDQLTMGNNGHSMQISLPSKMSISSLPHHYSAAQLHFHWGSSSQPGSEHMVNGKQFAAEMHIVHFNSDKYPNVSMAVDKSDGLAVLGVLIEVGEFNPAFDQFLKFINGVKYRDQKVQVAGFNIRSLLPTSLDEYYRYDGSLTTPPCYPSVLWTVFRNPITVSHKQFMTFATALYSSHAQESASSALNGNYRKPQQTDDRIVLVSFKGGRGLHGTATVTSPLMRKQIIQQLLIGDLADLADEKLYQLLPNGLGRSQADQDLKEERSGRTRGGSKKPLISQWKRNQMNRYSGKSGMKEQNLCYVFLEQRVGRQLKKAHTEGQLVQALRENVFPELNLKSYLECKSNLALPTIRNILRGRPTDEAMELDRSLTKATIGQKNQGFPMTKHRDSPSSGPALSQAHLHPWLLPMEWED